MIDQLRREWDRAVRAARLRNRIPGRLGRPDGVVVVGSRPGYLYVRLEQEGNQTVVIARNDGVPRRHNLPVWIELEYNTYVVTGVDGTRLEAFLPGGSQGGTIGYHTHRIGTGLEYEIEALRLEPGRVKHHSGMQVQINGFRYWTGSAWQTYAGEVFDLTSYQPGTAGTWAWVLVGIDPAINAATAVAGTAYGTFAPLTVDLLDDIDFDDNIPLAGVKVKQSDTSLSDINRYQDARPWLDYPAIDTDEVFTDWNRNGVVDNADTVAQQPIGHYRRMLDPLALTISYTKATLEDAEGLGLSDVSNPVIDVGTGSDSDLKIREIGNVIYEPDATTRRYKTWYTGYNAGADTDEKIHYAYSEDGKTWTKYASNPVISTRQEDPYVVKSGDTYYLYAEDKATQGNDGYIRRWSSSDGITWTDEGRITGLGADAQSPVVWIEGDTWYMLYELFPDPTPYTVGLATSNDGLAWTADAGNPVFEVTDTTGNWADVGVVPDDIIKIGATYTMIYHGQVTGTGSQMGIATSTDLTTWTDSANSPIDPLDGDNTVKIQTAQVFLDTDITFLYYGDDDTTGIYRGFPITTDSTTLTIASGAVTADKDYHVVAAESGTADDLATINGGADGQVLALRADSGDTITVKTGTGNVLLGSGADYSLSGNKTLFLYYDGTSWRDIAGGSAFDIDGLTEETEPDPSADTVAIYDESAAALRKVRLFNVPRGAEMLFSQIADVTIANTTTETTLFNGHVGSEIIPANSLSVGDVVRITADGHLSDTGNPTLNIKFLLGGVEICSTGAGALNTSVTNADWQLEAYFTVRSLGATGTVQGGGMFGHDNGTSFGMINTAVATVDTTTPLDIDLTATWGTASASNTLTVQQLVIEILPLDGLVSDMLLDSEGWPLLDSDGEILQESA